MNHLGLLWAHLKRLMLLFCLIGLQALIAPNMAQAETAAYPGPVLKRLFDLSRAHLPPRIREMAEIGEIALAQIEPGPILQRLYALATTEAGIAEPPVSTGLVQVLQESELSLKKWRVDRGPTCGFPPEPTKRALHHRTGPGPWISTRYGGQRLATTAAQHASSTASPARAMRQRFPSDSPCAVCDAGWYCQDYGSCCGPKHVQQMVKAPPYCRTTAQQRGLTAPRKAI